jgi:hypothetical protein
MPRDRVAAQEIVQRSADEKMIRKALRIPNKAG